MFAKKCRSRYTTKEEATKCENWHLKTDDLMIEEVTYIYARHRFPEFVMLSTKIGEKQVYKKIFEGEDDD